MLKLQSRDDADAGASLRLRLLSELRAVLHARGQTKDPAVRIVLSAAQVYLEGELRNLDSVETLIG